MSGPLSYDHSTAGNVLTDATGPYTTDSQAWKVSTAIAVGPYVNCDGAKRGSFTFGGYGLTGGGQSVTWFVEVSVNGSTWATLKKIDGKDIVTTASRANSIGGQLGFKTVGSDPDLDAGTINFPVAFPFVRSKIWQDATVDAVNTYSTQVAQSSIWE